MWKLLAKTKIVSELLMFPEDTPIDTLGPGDEGELILMTEVVNTVGKLEKRDASMVKEVTQVLIDFVNKARSVVRSRADFLRQISSTFSNKFITAQHALTKPLMDFIKELMERSKKTRQQWKKLLKRVRPDRSPWAVHPSLIRWEVDPTEGPMRMRLRLRKVWANHHPILGATYTGDGVVSGPSSANLSSGDLEDAPKIDPTNLYIDYDIPQQLIDDMNWVEGLCDDNEDFEMDSNFLEHELQPGDQIISTYKCASITPFHKRDGEILIGSFNAYFIDSHRFQTTAERRRKITSVRKHLIFPYDEIEAIHKRRYLLKNSALEIFLINGRTYLMAFEKESERDSIYDSLTKMEMVNFVDYENSAETLKADLTKRWQRGRVTNFEYLMHLNTLAGRSFNDLTQYPVFPFILSKYKKSRQLNVSDPSNYRNLSKPMGAQTEERLQKFVEKYNALIEMGEPPFLYGSHYSNIGTVLHFLVRLEPFSRYFVEFQGGKFDVPDRVFHSLDTTWDLSSAMSTSDVKELVPEFFYMPEFLVNDNGFKLGTKQDGQVVNNVILPYWAKGDAREFIERHREAMESRYVSENLHNWIDLMFGYKQTGEAALKAMNLFHPLTYEGAVDIDKIADPVMRAATITQISNYGQAPKQIFKRPHPSRGLVPTPIDTVYANYERLSPHPLYSLSGQVGYVEYVRGSPVALGINKCNLWPYGDLCLQWGNWDGSLRITSLKDKGRVVDQIESFEMFNDTIAAVDVSRNGWLIAAGFESSVVRLWRNRPYSMKYRQLRGEDVSQLKGNRLKSDNIALIAELNGHDGAVTCIKVSSDWSLVLSGSRDGTVIVWDSNHARYIRELRPLHSEEPVVVPNKEAPMSIDELSLINTLSAHDSSAENSSAEVSTEASPRARNLRKRPTGPPEPDLVNLGITAVNIHPFTGEIITVLETTKGSLIDMWSINGDRLASLLCSDQVLCVTFTTCKPGLGVNLLITGHMSGDVKLWSMRDLTLVKSLTRNATPVTAIGVSPDDRQIVTGDSSGMLVVYLAKPLDRPQLGLEVGL
jgi:WD40 repeat protein